MSEKREKICKCENFRKETNVRFRHEFGNTPWHCWSCFSFFFCSSWVYRQMACAVCMDRTASVFILLQFINLIVYTVCECTINERTSRVPIYRYFNVCLGVFVCVRARLNMCLGRWMCEFKQIASNDFARKIANKLKLFCEIQFHCFSFPLFLHVCSLSLPLAPFLWATIVRVIFFFLFVAKLFQQKRTVCTTQTHSQKKLCLK